MNLSLPLTKRSISQSSYIFSLFYLDPFIQAAVLILSCITTKMSYIPTSILNLLGMSKAPPPSLPENMTSMMRELVMDQQRTMFYTVTVSPAQQKKKDTIKTLTPSLKVKYG